MLLVWYNGLEGSLPSAGFEKTLNFLCDAVRVEKPAFEIR
mgnify:CR=1 FL=1